MCHSILFYYALIILEKHSLVTTVEQSKKFTEAVPEHCMTPCTPRDLHA